MTDERIRGAIRAAMAERDITQQALADTLGIKQPSVAAIVSGDRGKIPQSLIAVLDALGLELTVRSKGN